MKCFYVIATGVDCDGIPAQNEHLSPYDSLDKAEEAARVARESSDGWGYIVLDEDEAFQAGFLSVYDEDDDFHPE